MPELPEVETMRRGIEPIVASRITSVEPIACSLKPLRITPETTEFWQRVVGRTITCIDRLGKRVVVRLDSSDAIVFEPRMTGLVLLCDPPNEKHLRFSLQLAGGPYPRLLYWDRRGLGSVRLFWEDELLRELGPSRLGPDALELTPEVLRDRLEASQREIKVALLDQRAIAGIGNLYASEILHVARVSPFSRCSNLSRSRWKRVYDAIYLVLQEAIKHEGSTLGDGTYRNALNQTGGYQNLHRVYNREGERCVGCKRGHIRRVVQAQRSTFYCPSCQR